MANPYGFSLAETFGAAENIKGARTQNKRNALALSEEERVAAERPERERLAAEREAKLRGLRGQYAAGDYGAAQQLLAIDPEGGAKFIEAVGNMNQQQLDAAKRSVDELGKLSSYVLNGDTMEEQQRRYSLMRSTLSPDVQKGLPEQYDPNFMSMSLVRAQSMDQILENPEVVTMGTENVMLKGGQVVDTAQKPADVKSVRVGEEDVVYRDGEEIERGTRASTSSGSGSGSTTSDESLIYRMAGGLLGGTFDQDGNLIGLDPEARNKVQSITTEASKLWLGGQAGSRAEAVKMAANKFGVNVQAAPQPSVDDPGGIREYFLNQ